MSSSDTSVPPHPPGFGDKSEPSEPKKNQLIDEEARRLQDAATRAQAEASQHAPTDKLTSADQRALPEVLQSAYGYDIGEAEKFIALPGMLAAVRERHQLKLWFWRIEFEGMIAGKGPIGIDLFSDIVVGRDSTTGENIDIDLGIYDAFDKGVSRRHALLRPTRNKLYLIDLDSTNGTRVNSMMVGQGRAIEIHSGDTVTLGRFSFTVKILLTPEQTAPDDQPTIQEQEPLPAVPELTSQKLPEKKSTAPLVSANEPAQDDPKSTALEKGSPSSPASPAKPAS